jgi:hypothetical protein
VTANKHLHLPLFRDCHPTGAQQPTLINCPAQPSAGRVAGASHACTHVVVWQQHSHIVPAASVHQASGGLPGHQPSLTGESWRVTGATAQEGAQNQAPECLHAGQRRLHMDVGWQDSPSAAPVQINCALRCVPKLSVQRLGASYVLLWTLPGLPAMQSCNKALPHM